MKSAQGFRITGLFVIVFAFVCTCRFLYQAMEIAMSRIPALEARVVCGIDKLLYASGGTVTKFFLFLPASFRITVWCSISKLLFSID
jgi:hypothetical protein